MTEYNIQQKQIITQYRQANNVGFVINDDVIVEMIKKDMQKTGKIYPGFENLALTADKHKKTDRTPAPVLPNMFNNSESGNNLKGLSLEHSSDQYMLLEPTEMQTLSIDFLKTITGEADNIVKERENEAGLLSDVVNTWQEVFNKELAKSTVKKEIQDAKTDTQLLEKAARGEIRQTNFTGETTVTTFEEMFQKRRGVKFNEQAIEDCTEKSGEFARVKTVVDMINKTKQTLGYTTRGDVSSAMSPEESSAAIVKAFNISGIKKANDMNALLKEIETKYKDHPDIQKYGGNFRLEKNSKGQPLVMRTTTTGNDVPASNEELKIIAKEMGLRLDKSLANALGVEYNENASSEEMAYLTQQTYDKYQKAYEDSFAKAYGKKDLKTLAVQYVLKQQQGVANIEAGLNIASMALMIVPGGAAAVSGWALKGSFALKATSTGSKIVKSIGLVDKTKKVVKTVQGLQKIQQTASPFIMANMTLRPTELLEQLSSKNGMSAEEWKNWGQGVLQNSVYMSVGMGVSKMAETGAAMYKTKALVSTLKQAGKTTDEIAALVKANPVKFPAEIVKSFKSVDNMAKALQVSSEAALDISSTYLVNQAMGNGDLTKQDWIMSVGTALSGGVLQKQFAPLSTEAKVKYLQDAFKEINISKEEAQNILKTMDDISAGKTRIKKDKPVGVINSQHTRTDIAPEAATAAAHKEKSPTQENTPAEKKHEQTSTLGYEISRNLNRGKRLVKYINGKAVEYYEDAKRFKKGLSKLIDAKTVDSKLKNMGIERKQDRNHISQFLNNSSFESDEISNAVFNSIKKIKDMNIDDYDVEMVLYNVSNSGRGFDQNSIKIIDELSSIKENVGNTWNGKEYITLLRGKDNTEILNNLQDCTAALKEGYSLQDAQSLVSIGVKGVDGRKLYNEILNDNLTEKTADGLGKKFKAREFYKTCRNEDGTFNHEYWQILHQMDEKGIRNINEIFTVLKSNDTDITKTNISEFMTRFEENSSEMNSYGYTSILKKCINNEGRLDWSKTDEAKIIQKLGIDVSYYKNKDGSFNQNAIDSVKSLNEAGFDKDVELTNILLTANKAAIEAKLEHEKYSPEIIAKAIDLKNKGVNPAQISFLIEGCLDGAKLNDELLEKLVPIGKLLKREDSLPVEDFLLPLINNIDHANIQTALNSVEKLMQNGFSLHEVNMSRIFNCKDVMGVVPDNVVDAAIQLKQAGYGWNLRNILNMSRFDDGTLNKETFDFIMELKEKDISESYVDDIMAICRTDKGEFLKNNTETVLSLLKEYKDSEFFKKKNIENNELANIPGIASFTFKENDSPYVSERGNNIRLVDILVKASSDETGKIRPDMLNKNKEQLVKLYNELDDADKSDFTYYLSSAVSADGKFDLNVFKKINEIKNIDDGIIDPNYHKTIKNFLEACRDENGTFNIEKYNDAVKLVKKHGITKWEATYKLAVYQDLKPYENKKHVYDLSLTEKRNIQTLLLRHSQELNDLTEMKKILKSDIIPTTDAEYSLLMKQLSQSLGDTDLVLDKAILDKLQSNIKSLEISLQAEKPITKVSVDKTYGDLLKRIQSKMSGLSESEKLKIYDYLGFTVKNNEILGFTNTFGKDISCTDITNSFTKKAAEAVTKEIDDFITNNKITVQANPELSEILTSISKSVPEVYNKFSDPQKSQATLQNLKSVVENPTFKSLGQNDKDLLILASLLKDSTVGTNKETAYSIYNLSNKFNLTVTDREKLYRLLSLPDLIKNYDNADPKKTISRYYRQRVIESNAKEEALDMLAFTIKDKKLDDMSYLLYSSENNKLITPELQAELKSRIKEIKQDDFILPQSHTSVLNNYAENQVVRGHTVKIVNASSIPEFYAYVHTPEAGACNTSSRTTKFSNFEEFKNIDSNSVICTSYISSDKTATWQKHGFVFDVSSGNEYVGMGHDMFSLGKNTTEMIAEYYRNNGIKAQSGKGYKYSHRTFISTHLKDILHVSEHTYSELLQTSNALKEKLAKLDADDSSANAMKAELTKINDEIEMINADYIKRLASIKEKINSKQIDLDEVREIDPKLADAYEEFLSRDNSRHKFGKDALMRNDYWNEVLVSNPSISAIYTKNLNSIPEEYLIKAEEEGLPIVILK